MGLNKKSNQQLVNQAIIREIKRVNYWDTRYYKVLFEKTTDSGYPVKTLKKGAKSRTEPVLVEEYFPSVTEILNAYPKDFLAKWRGDVGNERADQIIWESQQLGSFVHFCAETIALGGAVIFNPVEYPQYTAEDMEELREQYPQGVAVCRYQKEFVMAWRISQFFNLVKPTDILVEQTVFSAKHKFAGTLDLLMRIPEGEYQIAGTDPLKLKEGWYLGDWKTGKQIGPTNKMQISSYMEGVMEGVTDPDFQLQGGLLLHTNAANVKAGIAGFKAHLVTRKEAVEKWFPNFLKVYDVYRIDKPVPTPEEFDMPGLLTYDRPAPAKTKKKKGAR